jgi:hypothetical protein
MKKTALTILLAAAFLGAGCSDSTETTAASTPVPELTAEQKAAIKNSEEANKAAEQRKKEDAARINSDTAVAAPQAVLPSTMSDPADVETTATPTAQPKG